MNQIKSFNIIAGLYSYYAKAFNEFAGLSPRHRPGSAASFEEMSQRWQTNGNAVIDSTGPRFEPQTYCSRADRITAWPLTDRDF